MKNVNLSDPVLARSIADITGDGHLQIKDWRHLISFYSKDLTEIEKVQNRFYYLFGIHGRLYTDNRNMKRYKLFFISKPIALFFKEMGTPVGNKTNTPFKVPNFIINGKSRVKSAYLQGMFDAEGSIYSSKNNARTRWRINFAMCKNVEYLESGIDYLNQIQQLLADFKVRTSPIRKRLENIRKDGSQSIQLQFEIEASSFRNFYKSIGFGHSIKREKLLQVLGPEAGVCVNTLEPSG